MEIAKQRAKLEPGDNRFICSRCLTILEEDEKCLLCSERAGEPVCASHCEVRICGCGDWAHPAEWCGECESCFLCCDHLRSEDDYSDMEGICQ